MKNDGGYIHPEVGLHGTVLGRQGITRRDDLAKTAMLGLIGKLEKTGVKDELDQWEAIPGMAYNMADAMIKEGGK